MPTYPKLSLLVLLAGQANAFQSAAVADRSAGISFQKMPSMRLLSALQTDEQIASKKEKTPDRNFSQLSSILNQVIYQENESKKSLYNNNTEIVTTSSMQNDNASTDASDAMGGLFWRAVVVALCALWASNFPVAKLIMSEPGVDSSLYAVTRFGVAALALLPGAIASSRTAKMDWETIKGSLICGSFVAIGYLGQTLGLLTTTASKSCVICSLHCVFVAIVAEAMRVNKAKEVMIGRTDFDFMRLVPAAVAVAGVAVVELKGAAGGPNIGDLLSFAQPIGFGLGYLILEELMAKRPDAAIAVSFIKLSVVALASLAMFELTPLIQNGADNWAFTIPDFDPIFASPKALSGIAYTGLVTTALALWVESRAFARVPATDASLILTTEPLFAAGMGALALGETFGVSDYVGASLIIGACVMATLIDNENREADCEPGDISCEPTRNFPFGSQ